MISFRARLLLFAATTNVIAVASTGVAFAGSFQVKTCAAAVQQANSSWTYVETGAAGKLEHGDGCASGTGEFGGLWVRDALGSGVSSNGDVSGFWRFDAPATTTITEIAYSRYLRTYDDQDWRSQLRVASGDTLESCTVPLSDPFCTLGASGGAPATFETATTRLEVGVRCATGSPSLFCINGATIHTAQATLYGATVTVDDPQSPVVGSLRWGLVGGGWLRGSQSVAMSGSDATGISGFDLTRDGGTIVKTDPRACDDRLAAPCASPGASVASAWTDVSTSLMVDGTHTIVGVARDAGNNATSTSPVEVQVDNTPPVGPVGLTGGVEWSNSPERSLFWSLPGGQAAPIEGSQVGLCLGGGSCFSPAATTTGSSFSLPSEGSWVAEVKLVDAAGNVTETPESISLGYDAGAPPAPVLGAVEGIGGSGYSVAVTANDPGPAPVTGLQGEACPASGGACQPITASGSPPDRASFELPSAGDWSISARTVDAAGNTSASGTTAYTVSAPTPTPTPSPSPEPSGTPTPTPDPTTSPSPSPTQTARTTPTLKITKTRLTRARVRVVGSVSTGATGRIAVTVRAHKRARKRTAKIAASGRFSRSFPLARRQRGAAKAKVIVSYAGDDRFVARTLRRTIRR